MSVAKIYSAAIRKNLRSIANWEPDAERKVGDYGVIEDGVFKYLGHITDHLNTKPAFAETLVSGEKAYQSKGITHSISQLGAGIGPDGSEWIHAGLSLKFSGDEAVLFKMVFEKRTRLTNTGLLASEIIRQYESGYWELHWVVVIETTTAKSCLIMASETANTEFHLEAKVTKLEEINLSHPELNFAAERHSQQNVNMKLGSPSTPLLSVARLHRRLFRRPSFRGADLLHEDSFLSLEDVAAAEAHTSLPDLGEQGEARWVLEETLDE
jgi:hypothetical protein